jgi:K+-transporting ATPase KdpF subunit
MAVHESLREALTRKRRTEMEYAIAGVISLLLCIYLIYALLRPEKF